MDTLEKTPNLRKLMPALYQTTVPPWHWEDVKKKDVETLCNASLGKPYPDKGLVLRVLGQEMLVNLETCSLRWLNDPSRNFIDCPLLELMTLVYLLHVSLEPIHNDLISVSELKDARFFQGPHALKTGSLIRKYGFDLAGFKASAERLAGESLGMADASFRFKPFPKIPMTFLLWEGDEEFGPNLTVLFDRSIEHHLNADGIWGIVTIISDLLSTGLSPLDL